MNEQNVLLRKRNGSLINNVTSKLFVVALNDILKEKSCSFQFDVI